MSELYIGLMSGTSIDGIDAILVNFSNDRPEIVDTHYTAYSDTLRNTILALCSPGEDEIERLGATDRLLGQEFAKSVKELLAKNHLSSQDIVAIGSHGQTIRHRPHQFTLQIGDPNIIAAESGIATVADFRRKDIALGGQGAPLVPAFHQFVFSSDTINRAIVNIGGIANITLLPKGTNHVLGFDTGPGNVLLDAWVNFHLNQKHDSFGEWASTGKIDQTLLTNMLADDYFELRPPKSTGREHFNLSWLENILRDNKNTPNNIQTTLVELTVHSIINAINQFMKDGEILICGGGAFNTFMMQRLKTVGNAYTVSTTQQYGIAPDWVEAIAFAWLARQTINKRHGNLISVTGAKQNAILGGIYY